MSANIYDWSATAANNSNSDGDLTWAEGQAPSTVNNSARVMMQRVKQLLVDIGGSIAAGGTANGLTVTASNAFTAYADGMVIAFRATASNSAAATLNVNGIGAKALQKMDSTGDVALVANDIRNTGIYVARYSAALNGAAGAWLLLNPKPSDVMPIGTVIDYAGATEPSRWLFCDGRTKSRTTYAALFAVIGTTYGVGDGSTTFNMPDCRGRATFGYDSMGGGSANRITVAGSGIDGDVIGNSGGAESVVLGTTQLPPHTHTGPSHTHTFSDTATTGTGSANHTHSATGSGVIGALQTIVQGGVANGSTLNVDGASGAAHTHSVTVGGTTSASGTGVTGSTGSGADHNNMPPAIILNKIIYAGV